MATRSEILRQLPITEDDFVVEVGAGHMPFHLSDLIVDKYPFENLERWDDIKNTAPVIKADAGKMPLGDGSCDVLFASHVIEHLDDPEAFVREVRRCSRHVYLEFPRYTRELMFAWSMHRWLVELDGDRLLFYRNDVPQMFGDFFHRNYDLIFHIWCELRFEELNTHLYIESERLECEFPETTAFERILQRSARGADRINFADRDFKRYRLGDLAKMVVYGILPPGIIQRKNDLVRRFNSRKQVELDEDLLERFICQACREGSLRFRNGDIVCESCDARYTSERGVFDFDV